MHSLWPARAPWSRSGRPASPAPRAPRTQQPSAPVACVSRELQRPAHLPPARPARSSLLPRAPPCLCRARAPAARCLAPHASSACAPHSPICAPRAPSPASCRRCSGCIAIQPCLSPSSGHNTAIVLRYSLSQPHALSSLQYNNCIAIHFPSLPAFLQYSLVNCIAIQSH